MRLLRTHLRVHHHLVVRVACPFRRMVTFITIEDASHRVRLNARHRTKYRRRQPWPTRCRSGRHLHGRGFCSRRPGHRPCRRDGREDTCRQKSFPRTALHDASPKAEGSIPIEYVASQQRNRPPFSSPALPLPAIHPASAAACRRSPTHRTGCCRTPGRAGPAAGGSRPSDTARRSALRARRHWTAPAPSGAAAGRVPPRGEAGGVGS